MSDSYFANKPTCILAASDDNAFIGLLVMIASSIINHCPQETIHFYIIDCGLSKNNKRFLKDTITSLDECAQLYIKNPDFSRLLNLRVGTAGLYTYARLLSSEVFPQLERAIYIDTDVIVNRDLRALFTLQLCGKPIAAAQDRFTPIASHPLSIPDWKNRAFDSDAPYFNAGVLLIDYDHWRMEKVGQRAIEFARSNHDICVRWDQTILNIFFYRRWFAIDSHWNYMVYSNIDETWDISDKNFHITGKPKQWDLDPRTNSILQNMFWSYLDRTAASGWRPWTPESESPIRLWLQRSFPTLHQFWKRVRPHLMG